MKRLILIVLMMGGLTARGEEGLLLCITNVPDWVVMVDEDAHYTVLDSSSVTIGNVSIPSNAETVVVSTNVVEVEGGQCGGCADWGIQQGSTYIAGHGWNCNSVRIGEGNKEVTTTVIETSTLTLTWRGKEEKLMRVKELSRSVKTYKRKEDWEEVRE